MRVRRKLPYIQLYLTRGKGKKIHITMKQILLGCLVSLNAGLLRLKLEQFVFYILHFR